jgi:hypothetical protein
VKTLIITISLLLARLTFSQTYSSITYESGTNLDIGSGADVCATNIYINGTYSGGGTICSGPLPVTLSSFTASAAKNNAFLNWTTESEMNNSGFDLERKLLKEGEIWQKIAFVQGSGTTSEQKKYSYEDKKLKAGTYEYRLKQLDYNGNFEYFNLENPVVIGTPKEFSLSQNYPNPFNPKSKIDFELPVDGKVTIKLYDIIGREVFTLLDENKEAGYYTAEFDGTNLSSGMYFYRISAGSFAATKKMLLVK